MAEGLLGCMKCASSFAKMVMPITTIAMAVVKHGVVSCVSLHGLQNQLFLS